MTKLIGILNITPDSFSDGGKYLFLDAALKQAEILIEQGANVIDIGAESTRPHATPLDPSEEWQRLQPIIPPLLRLLHATSVQLSVDTRHASTARHAIEAGVNWINDVSGGEDPFMRKAIADSHVHYVFMHHCGIPADPTHTLPNDIDVIATLTDWATERIALLENSGIARNRLIFDPGISFGKTAQQSFALIRAAHVLKATLDLPLLIGHSRKSFLASICPFLAQERDIETYAISSYLMLQGVDYLRVHDVQGNRRTFNALTPLIT